MQYPITGISEERKQLLFKLYTTTTSELGTSQEKGCGLGLLLVKEFVSLHGGTIESEVGIGSHFKFRFTYV